MNKSNHFQTEPQPFYEASTCASAKIVSLRSRLKAKTPQKQKPLSPLRKLALTLIHLAEIAFPVIGFVVCLCSLYLICIFVLTL